MVVAEADADPDAPVAVPVPPETPVGSLGCSAEVVVDSELRLLSVVVDAADPEVAEVSVTEVDVKVRIGPPGLVGLTVGESSVSVVRGSEAFASAAAAAVVAAGARRRARM